MVNRANGHRANDHRANGNRADVVAPLFDLWDIVINRSCNL